MNRFFRNVFGSQARISRPATRGFTPHLQTLGDRIVPAVIVPKLPVAGPVAIVQVNAPTPAKVEAINQTAVRATSASPVTLVNPTGQTPVKVDTGSAPTRTTSTPTAATTNLPGSIGAVSPDGARAVQTVAKAPTNGIGTTGSVTPSVHDVVGQSIKDMSAMQGKLEQTLNVGQEVGLLDTILSVGCKAGWAAAGGMAGAGLAGEAAPLGAAVGGIAGEMFGELVCPGSGSSGQSGSVSGSGTAAGGGADAGEASTGFDDSDNSTGSEDEGGMSEGTSGDEDEDQCTDDDDDNGCGLPPGVEGYLGAFNGGVYVGHVATPTTAGTIARGR